MALIVVCLRSRRESRKSGVDSTERDFCAHVSDPMSSNLVQVNVKEVGTRNIERLHEEFLYWKFLRFGEGALRSEGPVVSGVGPRHYVSKAPAAIDTMPRVDGPSDSDINAYISARVRAHYLRLTQRYCWHNIY